MDKRLVAGALLLFGAMLMVYSAESGEVLDQLTHPDQYKTVKCSVSVARNWFDAPYIVDSECSVYGTCNDLKYLGIWNEIGEYDGILSYQSASAYDETPVRVGIGKTEEYTLEVCEKIGMHEATLTLKDDTNTLDNAVKQVVVT